MPLELYAPEIVFIPASPVVKVVLDAKVEFESELLMATVPVKVEAMVPPLFSAFMI